MGKIAGKLIATVIVNMGAYALSIWVVRGIYFLPAGRDLYLTAGLVIALANTIVAPILMFVKIPRAVFIYIILLTGMNGLLLNYFRSISEGTLRIETLGWHVLASMIIAMLSFLMGAFNRFR